MRPWKDIAEQLAKEADAQVLGKSGPPQGTIVPPSGTSVPFPELAYYPILVIEQHLGEG
jgi:hypothetical protein